jgi:hypothetical protein
METIHIAVIATDIGFKRFIRDISIPDEKDVLYSIRFILIDDDIHKIRSNYFHSFVVHDSGLYFKHLDNIINSVQQRMIAIK